MNTTETENDQNQKNLTQTAFGLFTLFVGIAPMVFPTVIDILNIPIGNLTKGSSWYPSCRQMAFSGVSCNVTQVEQL